VVLKPGQNESRLSERTLLKEPTAMRLALTYLLIYPLIYPIGALLSIMTVTAHAQEEPHISVFDQLFKHPTGQNGYEDLVMAGEILHDDHDLDALQNGVSASSLSAKRHALATPEAQRVLALLRTGLDKPIASPRTTFDYSTLLPDYALLRGLARLLMSEQYVLLADGETGRAIQNLRDGLRLGQVARMEHLIISELVGIAIDRICLTELAKHIDQLSEHDCDSVLALLEEWRGGNHSPIPSLQRERDTALKALEQVRQNPVSMLHELFPDPPEDDKPDASAQIVSSITNNTAAVGQIVDEAAGLINQQYEALVASVQLPPWQRPEVKIPEGKTPGYKLFDLFNPSYDQVLSRFTQDEVNLQLLTVHVAIRRYRWQYDRLPDRLEQLRLENLTTDPFTGKPLIYQRKGETYDLYSAGAYDHDDNGDRIPGKRIPVSLPH
jgi:hypothetical protein